MFDPFERRIVLSDADFAARRARYREALISAQQRLRKTDVAVHLIFAGLRGAGQLATLSQLMHWLDPRWVRVVPPPRAGEGGWGINPDLAPFWWRMPQRGHIGLYLHGWYEAPLSAPLNGEVSQEAFETHLVSLAAHERLLAREHALVLKFWFHLDAQAQAERLDAMARDPVLAARLEDADWLKLTERKQFLTRAARTIAATNAADAPWHIVDGFDANHRACAVFDTFLASVEPVLKKAKKRRKKLRSRSARAVRHSIADAGALITAPRLPEVDLDQKLEKEAAARLLEQEERNLALLWQQAKAAGLSVVIAVEGWDAAGKGGAIRHLTHCLDVRDYKVVPISAPSDYERSRPWLWRFWHHLAPQGMITVYDRTWYGRVLVEWIEGLISDKACLEGYGQIRNFEASLKARDIVLVKLWMHISADEQLKRFQDREEKPYKRWKLTDEDWRNREKRNLYEIAAERAFVETDTPDAPWTLVAAESKPFARLSVIRAVCEALHSRLADMGLLAD